MATTLTASTDPLLSHAKPVDVQGVLRGIDSDTRKSLQKILDNNYPFMLMLPSSTRRIGQSVAEAEKPSATKNVAGMVRWIMSQQGAQGAEHLIIQFAPYGNIGWKDAALAGTDDTGYVVVELAVSE